MEVFELLIPPPQPSELLGGERTIDIDADAHVGECYPFWTVTNINRPHKFADPEFGKELAIRQPFAKEVNLVYLLGGRHEGQNCWFRGVGPGGEVHADFSGLISQLTGVTQAGYVPRIILNNVPGGMSDPPTACVYGNTAPPKDERVWHQYVRQAIEAMVRAFGMSTVSAWKFDVGCEPDLCPEHWAGTKEQYLAHYDYTVDAVTQVIPEAWIGPGNILNPAEKQARVFPHDLWGLDIIDHAAAGINACTGRRGTRMTAFSFSWYAFVGVPTENFDHAINAVRRRLARYPHLANVTVDVGEFAVLCDENRRRIHGGDTTEWAASFYAALADRVYSNGIQKVYEWAQTSSGLLHPRASVIAMLQRMNGGQRLATTARGESAAECGAIACRKRDDLLVLLYHHRRLRQSAGSESVNLIVRDARMKAGDSWRLSEWTIDATHATWCYKFWADCEAAGVSPLPDASPFEGVVDILYGQPGLELFRRNRDTYSRLAEVPATLDDIPLPAGNGQLTLNLNMPAHSVRLLHLSPPRLR